MQYEAPQAASLEQAAPPAAQRKTPPLPMVAATSGASAAMPARMALLTASSAVKFEAAETGMGCAASVAAKLLTVALMPVRLGGSDVGEQADLRQRRSQVEGGERAVEAGPVARRHIHVRGDACHLHLAERRREARIGGLHARERGRH